MEKPANDFHSSRAYNTPNVPKLADRAIRSLVGPVIFLLFFPAMSARAQGNDTKLTPSKPGEPDLVLKATGNGRVSGRMASFRIYEAPDGVQTSVWYGVFASDEQAESEINRWIQPFKVMRWDQAKNRNGDVIGERVLGSVRNNRTGRMEYLLVRRDILSYWRIQSQSLADATQLDASIDVSSLSGK